MQNLNYNAIYNVKWQTREKQRHSLLQDIEHHNDDEAVPCRQEEEGFHGDGDEGMGEEKPLLFVVNVVDSI